MQETSNPPVYHQSTMFVSAGLIAQTAHVMHEDSTSFMEPTDVSVKTNVGLPV